MAKLFNLARMTTASTGAGTITLGSAAVGCLSFAAAGVADGDIVSYGIKDGANSEVGTGIYTATGTTLTRAVTRSTNGNAAISLGGTAEVFVTARAEDFTGPYASPNDYNAAGSGADTTGTIAAGSPTLTLALAKDFKNGQGIRINHAGAAFAIPQPTGLGVTRVGTAGTTTYTYTVASLNDQGGVGQSVASVAITTGFATLSASNSNTISWTAAAGAKGYAVYGRVAGSLALIGYTGATSFNDMGASNTLFATSFDWLPSAPQTSASLPSWLVTTITAGAGSTTLTLAANATSTATSQFVTHDDTAAIQGAINAAQLVGGKGDVYVSAGTYRITSTLNITGHVRLHGAGYQGDSGLLYATWPTVTNLVTATDGYKGTMILPTEIMQTIGIATNDAVELDHFAINYVKRPLEYLAIGYQSLAGTTDSNSGSSVHDLYVIGFYEALMLQDSLHFSVRDNHFILGWTYGVQVRSVHFPSYGDSSFTGNTIWMLQTAAHQWSFILSAGGGLRISNNKFNVGQNGHLLIQPNLTVQQTVEPLLIVNNSIEGSAIGLMIINSNVALAQITEVVIVGNQIWSGVNTIRLSANGTTKWLVGFTITGNALMVVGAVGVQNIVLDNCQLGIITGNQFAISGTGSASTGVVLGANATQVSVQSNIYDPIYTTKVNNLGTGNTVGVASA